MLWVPKEINMISFFSIEKIIRYCNEILIDHLFLLKWTSFSVDSVGSNGLFSRIRNFIEILFLRF